MRRRSGHKAAYLLAVAALSTGLLGSCSSSGSSGAKSGDVTTTAAAGSGSQDATTTAPDASTGDADAGAKLTDGKADAAHTVTMSEKSMSPDTLSISKGDIVTFVGDGAGVHSVIVPGLDGASVTKGLFETFEFPKAGTFVVTDDIGPGTLKITVS